MTSPTPHEFIVAYDLAWCIAALKAAHEEHSFIAWQWERRTSVLIEPSQGDTYTFSIRRVPLASRWHTYPFMTTLYELKGRLKPVSPMQTAISAEISLDKSVFITHVALYGGLPVLTMVGLLLGMVGFWIIALLLIAYPIYTVYLVMMVFDKQHLQRLLHHTFPLA
jgi:hypothetical protein